MTAVSQKKLSQKDSIDFNELFHVLRGSWKTIALCLVLSLSLASLYLRVARSTYVVDGLVQVQSGQGLANAMFSHIAGITGGLLSPDMQSQTQAEIGIVRSRFVLNPVIDKLQLDVQIVNPQDGIASRVFSPVHYQVVHSGHGVSYISKSLSLMVSQFDVPDALREEAFKLTLKEGGHYTLSLMHKEKISGYENQLDLVGNVGVTEVFPLANGNLHIKIDNVQGSGVIDITQKSLLGVINDIQSNLAVSEQGKMSGIIALSYRGKDPQLITDILNNIMAVYYAQNVDSRAAETQKTLKFLDQQLPALHNDLLVAEHKFNDFRKANNTIDLDQESKLLLQQAVDLKTKKLELQQQKALLDAKYTSRFPLNAQIDAQLSDLDHQVADLEKKIALIPMLQSQYLDLYGDVQIKTTLYSNVMNTYQQFKIMNAGQIGDVRLLDSAVLPRKPISPLKPLVFLLSVIAGVLIGCGIILVRRLLSPGVTDSFEVEAETGLQVIATVPHSIIQEKLFRLRRVNKLSILAKEDAEDPAVESLRSLRATIHFAQANARNNIILISGASPEVGKSFVTVNFAVVMAQMGKSVLLIDADMRRGYLHEYFKMDNIQGLSSYLSGQEISRDQICRSTGVSGLDFISRGPAGQHSTDLLHGERFNQLIQTVSAQYDYVIIDSAPILAAADALVIANLAATVLLVAHYAKTPLRELNMTISRLKSTKAHIEGVVLNNVPMVMGESYQYSYHYRTKN